MVLDTVNIYSLNFKCMILFFQAEHGIRVIGLTGVQTCALPIDPDAGTLHVGEAKGGRPRHVPLDDEALAFLRPLAAGRRRDEHLLLRADGKPWAMSHQLRPIDRKSVVSGNSVDLGGRRIIKKKK